MELLKKVDRGVARVEGWATVLVLLTMVLVAGFQALVRNLTRFDVAWANQMLSDMDWADSTLRKGTMWLAFLGASLATHTRKHIGIDILVRVAPPTARYIMRALSGMISGLISLGLVVSFWSAVSLNLTERPMEYEVLGDDGPMHVCDAPDARIAQLPDLTRPLWTCAIRGALHLIGIRAETAGAAFQLIAPVMLAAIGLRSLMQGIEAAALVWRGPAAIAQADARQRAAEQAVSESVSHMDPEDAT